MKRYKYYILAGIFAVLLTVLQIFLSKAVTEKDKGHVYVAQREFLKGEHINAGDVKKVQVYGITSTFTIDESRICITDIPEGTILSDLMLGELPCDKGLRTMCLPVDKNRCPSAVLTLSDTIDVYIIPDDKSISLSQSIWLDKMLEELKIPYNPDNDIGFMIENLEIADLGNYESSNYTISIKITDSVDELLSFLKGRSTMEIILPKSKN